MSYSSLARRLAEFVEYIEYNDLPSEVVMQAKRCLLDTIGVVLAGSKTETGLIFSLFFKELGGIREATIFGDGSKVPATHAALVNGTMGHVHELDDGHRFALGHPGVTSIPAALAVAEKVGVGGKELIAAICLGYEIFARIAKAVNPSHRSRGFHTTGTCGTFGATVSAAKILGLKDKSIVNAFGIAGLQTAGLMEVMRGESRVKPFNAGRAASNGVLSALLADKGITAPETILEGDNGFLKAYSDKVDLQKIIDGLGEDFEIMKTYVKLHAACRHAHPAIDCMLHLINEYNLTSDQVESIAVKTYSAAYNLTGKEYHPKTESTAKFSIPYCLAAALIYGRVGLNEFDMDKINNKVLLQLASKVKVEVNPDIDRLVPDKRGASIDVVTKSGERHKWTVENPRGEPEDPVTEKELKTKFTTLVSPILDTKRATKIINIIDRLEYLENVNDLTNIL